MRLPAASVTLAIFKAQQSLNKIMGEVVIFVTIRKFFDVIKKS